MKLEKFMSYLYDPASGLETVNEVGQHLFTKKNRAMESLPPTSAALKLHTRRAALQANCWEQAMVVKPVLYDPTNYGWIQKSDDWYPVWTDLPEVSECLRLLVRCGCKKGCRTACKCKKNNLMCTALCTCNGDCEP